MVRPKTVVSGLLALLMVFFLLVPGRSEKTFPSPAEVANKLKGLSSRHSEICRLSSVGKSYGGQEIFLLEIAAGKERTKPANRPGVLVVANSEGIHLPGTVAALQLAESILAAYGKDKAWTDFLNSRVVYVIPLLNPDAAAAYFSRPLLERTFNTRPVDEDNDGLVDEDGPEDLNGDGLITMMRVKSPEGRWILDPKNPGLMRQADPKKGEKGEYELYTEGIDNDGDGLFNEDGPGGVEINRNFPHDFEYFQKRAGLYPVSEPESEALLRFMFEHKNIAMVINFSTENNLLNMQQTGQARVGAERVRVPRQFASMLGLDPDTEYTLKEIVDALKGSGFGGGMEIDESLVATFLGLGPAVTLDRSDQAIYEELQKDYKNILKAAGLDYLEKRARGVGKGSFAAFCYYQYGVPVFSFDLWQVPEPKKEEKKDELTPERLKSMSSEEFLALGEEKIAAFLKERGAPPSFNASMLIKMVKSGQVTPARMAEMMGKMPGMAGAGGPAGEEHQEAYLLAYSDNVLKGAGFIDWKPFKHPQLGEVEIGGFVPYLKYTPPPDQLQASVKVHVDFCQKLMMKLPELSIKDTKVEKLGADLYRITVYLHNSGWLPTSFAQGRRALTAYPIRVTLGLDGKQKIFAGRPVETLPFLNGGETRKLEWMVLARKGSTVRVRVWSNRITPVEKTIKLD
ncbi:MAG: M14 family metallopeptidase [Candidatus Saccharicenans sp.]|nr:M14 family metallopeptidase [Candidatus Saccharicenans sp.]